MFNQRKGVVAPKVEVKVASMPAELPLERRVARVKRIRASLERDPKHPKKGKLEAELNAHLEELLAYKEELEKMFEG